MTALLPPYHMKTQILILFIVNILALQGRCIGATNMTCAAGPVAVETNAISKVTRAPLGLSSYVPDDKYKLRIGDKVSFQIMED